MSTILEALRRLQAEREDGERTSPADSFAVATPVSAAARPSGRGRTVLLIGAMALVGSGGGAYLAAWIFSQSSSEVAGRGSEDGDGASRAARSRSRETREVSTAALPRRSLREESGMQAGEAGADLQPMDGGAPSSDGAGEGDPLNAGSPGAELDPTAAAMGAADLAMQSSSDPAARLAARAAAQQPGGSVTGAAVPPAPDPAPAADPAPTVPVPVPEPASEPPLAAAALTPPPAPEPVAPLAPAPAVPEPVAPAPAPAPIPVRQAKPRAPRPEEQALEDPIAFPALAVTKVSWHPDPKRRAAQIRVEGSAPQDAREGDLIDGVMLTRISPGEVEFKVGARSKVVRLGK